MKLPHPRMILRSLLWIIILVLLPVIVEGATPVQPATAAGPATTTGPGTNPTPSTSDLWQQSELLGSVIDERGKLEDKGVTFTPIYTGEVFGNPVGGTNQDVIVEHLLELQLTLDFQKMVGWDASFHASAYYPLGNSLTGSATHELLLVSNVSAYNTPHLFELWYEQKVWDDKVSIRAGQLAADSEFFISSNAANFLNATYGWPAILSANTPAPAYDYASLGLRLRIDPDEHWSILSGVYAGNPAPDRIGDPDPNRAPDHQFDNSGTDFYLNNGDGAFSISELWYKLNPEKDAHGLPGTFKVGGWFQTGTFSDKHFDAQGVSLGNPASSGQPRALDGNYGLYVNFDQAIWQDKSDPNQTREIDFFFRGGNAPSDRNLFDYYADGGITFTGLIPSRANDLVGLATAYANISPSISAEARDANQFNGTNVPVPDGEHNIEVTYLAQFAPWWTVQPDLQIIVHPGGSAAIHNEVVLGCRTVVTF